MNGVRVMGNSKAMRNKCHHFRLSVCKMTFITACLFWILSVFLVHAQNDEAATKEWWRNAAIYQIYPLSLKDSDNDGRGDLKGIIEKIPYLKETGFDAVWISPIYSSPMADFGYDISNYTGIHEWYGTMEDFDQLSKTIHDSDMKLIMDFVPNHSSNQHPWFTKSENKEPGYEDYYVWKDPKGFDSEGKPIPPNNWVSIFYGPAWTYSEKRKQFYLHAFLKEQPDLNYRNPRVIDEMKEVILFWLKRGVDGFRIDAIPFMFEDSLFRDEPKSKHNNDNPMDPNYLDHIYTQHLPETYALVQQWRKLVDDETAKDGIVRALMVEAYGELHQVIRYFGEETKLGAHFPFNFQLLGLNQFSTARQVKRDINSWLDNVPDVIGHFNWVVGNHDQHRVGSKIGADLVDGINMLVTLLPGTSVTYYGEEIGMVNNDDITYEEGVDPQGCRYPKVEFKWRSRDFERTPFQWDATVNAGFNKGKKPWLPVNKNYKELNLESQKGKPHSHYTIFTDLMKLRKTPVIQNGGILIQSTSKGTLGFVRTINSNSFVVVLINFSKTEDQIDLDSVFLTGKRKLTVYTTNSESGFKKGSTVDSNSVKLPARSSIVLTTL